MSAQFPILNQYLSDQIFHFQKPYFENWNSKIFSTLKIRTKIIKTKDPTQSYFNYFSTSNDAISLILYSTPFFSNSSS